MGWLIGGIQWLIRSSGGSWGSCSGSLRDVMAHWGDAMAHSEMLWLIGETQWLNLRCDGSLGEMQWLNRRYDGSGGIYSGLFGDEGAHGLDPMAHSDM